MKAWIWATVWYPLVEYNFVSRFRKHEVSWRATIICPVCPIFCTTPFGRWKQPSLAAKNVNRGLRPLITHSARSVTHLPHKRDNALGIWPMRLTDTATQTNEPTRIVWRISTIIPVWITCFTTSQIIPRVTDELLTFWLVTLISQVGTKIFWFTPFCSLTGITLSFLWSNLLQCRWQISLLNINT